MGTGEFAAFNGIVLESGDPWNGEHGEELDINTYPVTTLLGNNNASVGTEYDFIGWYLALLSANISLPSLSASISPLSESINVGNSVTFTSTASGGTPPYNYQWYLDGNPVTGAISHSWTFTPIASGIYYVYLKVTDSVSNIAQSETARISVASPPVGGYSFPIEGHASAKPLTPYLTLMVLIAIGFVVIRRKTARVAK